MMEYDPDRKLWKPGRRSFLFMFGAALVGANLPPETTEAFLVGPIWGEDQSIKHSYDIIIEGVYSINPMMYTLCEHPSGLWWEGSGLVLDRTLTKPIGSA